MAYEELDFRGSDIKFELMENTQTCQKTCTEDPNCQFYTYVNENFSDRNYWYSISYLTCLNTSHVKYIFVIKIIIGYNAWFKFINQVIDTPY